MSLDALFKPRSLAVIGASNDPNKVGGRPIAFLKKAGWAGRIVPVNPAAMVQGLAAVAALRDAGAVDQVIVALPAAQVAAAVQDCIGHGVKAVLVFSADVDLQPLLPAARAAGMRLLGPNSLGLFNVVDGFFGTFATALDGAWPVPGGIGVATQSGAFGSYFFGLAQQRGLRFSHFAATGNEADVDVADCVAWFAADPATTLIVIAMEGCKDGRKLVAALQAARASGKPVLAMKVGVSATGAQAAATHTGSMAGADAVFDAALRDAGARRLNSLEALVDAAYLASCGPRPASRELLVVTTSGGIGVLVADAAEANALALPPISSAARAAVRELAPLADGHNPVDTSAGILGELSLYARIAECAIADRPFGAVLLYLAHVARNPAHWAQLRGPLLALRARHAQLPMLAVLLADAVITADLEKHHIAVFTDPSRAVAAIGALVGLSPGSEVAVDTTPPAAQPALRLLGAIDTEAAAKQALAQLGIPFAEERFVRDADQAAAAARELGWPVVLKVVSAQVLHKTEAGGVVLGLANEEDLRKALALMALRVRAHVPQAVIDGFIVARQLVAGVEVLVGTQNDPVFGPVITVGLGGIHTELWRDVQLQLAPVSAAQAIRMLMRTHTGALLQGWRGSPAVDMPALAQLVARLSDIAWANREHIASIELNPVLARPDGAWALDALVTYVGAAE